MLGFGFDRKGPLGFTGCNAFLTETWSSGAPTPCLKGSMYFSANSCFERRLVCAVAVAGFREKALMPPQVQLLGRLARDVQDLHA